LNFCVKLPEKIEIFRKYAWKNRIFFYPDPRFKTRLTPLPEDMLKYAWPMRGVRWYSARDPVLWQGPGKACDVYEVGVNVKCKMGI